MQQANEQFVRATDGAMRDVQQEIDAVVGRRAGP
jgi:hypothetical protein